MNEIKDQNLEETLTMMSYYLVRDALNPVSSYFRCKGGHRAAPRAIIETLLKMALHPSAAAAVPLHNLAVMSS
jgi:hypothetical protein